ncbi:MAG: ATPase [Acidobacteria bacterium]|nr:ATPase [Acidobacteriota bacterium]
MGYFLGIDGGQSHTTALIANARGNILGIGHAGESNHTRAPGGRERLTKAINQSLSEALAQAGQQAGLLKKQSVAQFKFTSAYLSMTGEPEDKRAIVKELLCADVLTVEHDTRGALAGAFAGGAGVIVMAGTGSVACGETADQRFVRVGGRGYLFADEGSAFAIARQAVTLAMRHAERIKGQDALQAALLKHFKRTSIEQIIEDVYANEISRERLASFAAKVAALAERKEPTAQAIIDRAAADLAELAEATAKRLALDEPFNVSYSGGVFKSRRLLAGFTANLAQRLPQATIVAPRFGPDLGALLLAYRQTGKRLTPKLLDALAKMSS